MRSTIVLTLGAIALLLIANVTAELAAAGTTAKAGPAAPQHFADEPKIGVLT
ncbi:MAG TPA: hypothetical protein VMI56_25845 [Reyranella sp.]|nr:hypothetical protein [Reyranella sp.]